MKPEQSHRISQRADSVEQHSGTLPPLSKNWIQGRSGSAKSTPQVSPSRSMQSNRSRGSHNSPAVIRSGLMDRLDDLKDEIKEIENRIAKRQRELEKWKSLTVNTSARRRQFVEKLLEENNALERKLEKYDGQVINVAFLIARTDEQLRRAEARLKEVKKIKQLLEARDKKAAHTIEVAHRFMPSAMELETREVNETIYTCAALEKKVAEVHKSIQRTGESLELMNRNINRLQRDVERRNISSMPVKAYENLRETHELQQREIQRLRASISIYINAVESERARLASHQNANNRGSMDQSPDKIAVLQKKREALQDEVEDVMLAIEQRIQKINANKEYMEYLRKSRFNADEKGTPSATEARSNSRTPVQSNSRPASTTVISSTADPTPEANEPIQNPVETPPNDSSQTDTELLPHKSPILVSSSASSKEMDSRAPPSEFSETAAPKEEIDPVKDETKPAEKSPSTSSASLPWL